jgi:hypothetical protein
MRVVKGVIFRGRNPKGSHEQQSKGKRRLHQKPQLLSAKRGCAWDANELI